MGHPRRYFENKCVYFLTNRLARGLPLVPCGYINKVIQGVMAKASESYPSITICHYLWMRNHYHILIVTDGNPFDLSAFMNILNGEIAKAVVRFLGRRNIKVWAQRYNPMRLLTPEDVVEKIVYTYLNPVTANLVDKACRWPGVSSFGIGEEKIIDCEYIRPSKLQRLENERLTKCKDKELLSNTKPGKKHKLSINPNAWVECFEDPESVEFYISQISSKIKSEEKRLEEKRKYPVMGALEAKTQNPYDSYIPKNKGRRMFCKSSCNELRKQFIQIYKDFCERCVLVWRNWKEGNLSHKYPPGAYVPPFLPLANAMKFQT